MSEITKVQIGARITTETGLAQGRVGAVATIGGTRLILTARHVAHAETSPKLYQDGNPIGHRVLLSKVQPAEAEADDNPEQAGDLDAGAAPGLRELPPFFEMIAAIEIEDPRWPIDMIACGMTVCDHVDDPIDLLGQLVFKLCDSGQRVSGSVTAVGGLLRLRNSFSNETTEFRDVIEITFDRVEPGLLQGEAGAPITDMDGRLLGLVIAGSPQCCQVAPIAPFLQGYGLQLFNSVRRPESNRSDLAVATASLRAVSQGLAEWRRELNARPRTFDLAAIDETAPKLEKTS